ncbi:MAG: ATP-grasp domain-containing protein [Pseudomonadota bacterium]
MARLLNDAGHRVILADTPERPISAASVACAAHEILPPPRFEFDAYADAVTEVIRNYDVDRVVPTCEEVFYLAQVWRKRTIGASLFAPDINRLTEVHDKHAFIRLTESLGLAVPETVLLRTRDDLAAILNRSAEFVFKPVWSRFANDVRIRPNPRSLHALKPTPCYPWIAQGFIDGEEVSAYAIASAGTVKALAVYRSLYRAGRGAGVCFERISDHTVRRFVEAFIAGTAWSGQIAFDFMREANGRIMPLECNPRATSGLHFFSDPKAFSGIIISDRPAVEPDVEGVQGVPLALWVYGLPDAVRAGQLRSFLKVSRRMRNILDWPGDSGPRLAQWRALAEIAKLAVRHRIGLRAASTRDIEWNGPDQSSTV